MPITGSMLYDLVQCPHRVHMDLFGDPATKLEPNEFVQMLWERGMLWEREVIENLGVPFLDLSGRPGPERERLTMQAMDDGADLIYGGRITAGDRVGDPDLLRREHDGYVPGDIKSGAGLEGAGDDLGKPKKHYGVQLGLYEDVLVETGRFSGGRAFVWDSKGDEVAYDFDSALGPRTPSTMRDVYRSSLATARQIIGRTTVSRAASSAQCKLCHWYEACRDQIKQADDLTLVPGLGRSKRDVMLDRIGTVEELAQAPLDHFLDAKGKKTIFKGIGKGTLEKFMLRARMLKDPAARPILTAPVSFPVTDWELAFDIETDPFRNNFCYLNGFVERFKGDDSTRRYVPFYAHAVSEDEEERAFREAWEYIGSRRPCTVYYYSKYERTIWRVLRERYPHVCTEEELEGLFVAPASVDLYEVVSKATEWPTNDHSIKTLAKYQGFQWRDTNPSGAASIQWFHEWVQGGNPQVLQRILDYNEDDNLATFVVLDAIRGI